MNEINSAKVKSNPAMYSQAIEHGGLLFVSGQVPRDQETGQFVTGNFEAEVRSALDNAQAIVEQAGASLADVCKVTAYLEDPNLFDVFNRVYLEYFFARPLPARTTIAARLIRPEVRFEIDLIAALPEPASNRARRDRLGRQRLSRGEKAPRRSTEGVAGS